MPLRLQQLLPTRDNAARRLILSEILGEPLGVKLRRESMERARAQVKMKPLDPLGRPASTTPTPSQEVTSIATETDDREEDL